MLKIAVASGKGGTGKTLISTNMAFLLSRRMRTVYVDLDVEAPNGGIFLKPQITEEKNVYNYIPAFDSSKCIDCGLCKDICEFRALTYLGNKNVLIFPELCHSCGGCSLICKVSAITEKKIQVGRIRIGNRLNLKFIEGRLEVGKAVVPFVSEQVKTFIPQDIEVAIIDAPPGTSCPAVNAIKDCERVILVSDPTPFGFNDLKLAIELTKKLKKKAGVVINKYDIAPLSEIENYLKRMGIPILGYIPYIKEIEVKYSKAEMVCTDIPEITESLIEIFEKSLNGGIEWR